MEPNKNNLKLYLVLGAVFLIAAQGAFAMSAFGKEKVLFSPVSGILLNGGQPVSGAVVKRSCQWTDSKSQDETVTDSSGEFSFEAQTMRSLLWSIIPHNPAVFQTIAAVVGDKSYEVWEFKKGDYKLNSEADGRPFSIRCDIQDEPQSHDINQLSRYYGICTIQ